MGEAATPVLPSLPVPWRTLHELALYLVFVVLRGQIYLLVGSREGPLSPEAIEPVR